MKAPFLLLLCAAGLAAQTAALTPVPRQQFLDTVGRPATGGCLYSYQAGTSTPQATYSDSSGTPNANPVVLDSSGRANVWLGAVVYKLILTSRPSGGACTATPTGAIQWTQDNVQDVGLMLANASMTIQGAKTFSNNLTVGTTVLMVPSGGDDTATLQAALSAGKAVTLTPGTYNLKALSAATSVVLECQAGAVLTFADSTNFGFSLTGLTSRHAIRGCTINYTGITSTTPIVSVASAFNFDFADNKITAAASAPCVIVTSTRGHFQRNYFYQCRDYAVSLSGAWGTEFVGINRLVSTGGTGSGIILSDSSATRITKGTYIEGMTDAILFSTNPSNSVEISATLEGNTNAITVPKISINALSIRNGYFEANSGNDLNFLSTGVGAAAASVTIASNEFASVGGLGISIDNLNGALIENNRFGRAVTYGSTNVGLMLLRNTYSSTRTVSTTSWSQWADAFGTGQLFEISRDGAGALRAESQLGTVGVATSVLDAARVTFLPWTFAADKFVFTLGPIISGQTATADAKLANSQCMFYLAADTSWRVRCKGSDGIAREAALVLAP